MRLYLVGTKKRNTNQTLHSPPNTKCEEYGEIFLNDPLILKLNRKSLVMFLLSETVLTCYIIICQNILCKLWDGCRFKERGQEATKEICTKNIDVAKWTIMKFRKGAFIHN